MFKENLVTQRTWNILQACVYHVWQQKWFKSTLFEIPMHICFITFDYMHLRPNIIADFFYCWTPYLHTTNMTIIEIIMSANSTERAATIEPDASASKVFSLDAVISRCPDQKFKHINKYEFILCLFTKWIEGTKETKVIKKQNKTKNNFRLEYIRI